jgi:hypothetical protein
MGHRTVAYAGLIGKPQGNRRLGNMSVNGRIILKRDLQGIQKNCGFDYSVAG